MDISELWAGTLALLEPEISPISFKTWIEPIVPVKISGNTVVLRIDESFIKSMVETRFLSLIENSVKHIMGCEYKVHIISGDEKIEEVIKEETKQPKSKTAFDSNLNPKYVFSTFVVGNSNRMAHAASLAVAEAPAKAYNPFFLYGGVGLGKTHLMHSIAHYILDQNPNTKVLYASCETFTNELINSIRDDNNEEFRRKYRNIDVLLIDDIQFISQKERTQEEFFHTFNALYESGKQIVLTSDRPPKEMTQLEDRLRTRFEWGLMVDVEPPDYETRLAIIRNKAALLGINLPDRISSMIAENITANVRQIEGVLNKILAYSDLMGVMDEEAIMKALEDVVKNSNEYIPTPESIIDYISKYFGIEPDVLQGQSRSRDITNARQIAMYLIRRMTNLSLKDIGKALGNRDHSTVMHSLEKVEAQMRSDPAFAETVKEITTNINAKQ